jgi:peptidylprolyl isomerase
MTLGRVALCIGFACVLTAGAACRQAEAVRGTVAPPDVAAAPADATVTPTGLAFRVLARGGHGRHPSPESRVLVNYTGWTTDGRIIDGAPVGTEPAAFRMTDVMPGWQEGLRMMVEGDKCRFWIPPALAFAHDPGKPQGTLVYDITLVRIVE